MIELNSDNPYARHRFSHNEASYFVERASVGDRGAVDASVSAYRAGTRTDQTMTELVRVARVTSTAADGHPQTWVWLNAEEAREALASA